ncbi:MAG TPA: hypothetical protein DDW52_02650, partial [Planctomycetaceae bacterium]|nr:hypothetical protein [Planctomycetaceae bacterium]
QLTTVSDQRRVEASRFSHSLKGELDWIVMKALEKNRARRYQSSAEFANEIDRYLAGEPVEACPPTLGYRVSKFARQNRALLTIATLVLGLLSLGIATTGWQAYRASKAEALALAESNRKSDALLELDQALTKSKSETQEKERALEAESRLRRRSEALATFLTEVFEAPSEELQPDKMKAVDLLNKSRDMLLANDELEDLNKGSMLVALALSYKNLTLFDESLRCIELGIKHLEEGNASEMEMVDARLQRAYTMALASRNRENARNDVRDAIQFLEEQFGPDHEKTLMAKMHLSRMLTDAEIYVEAKKLADEVLSLADPESDVYLYSMLCRIRIARQRRDSDRCIELCDQLLKNPKLNMQMKINTLNERVEALSHSGRRIEAVEEAIVLKKLALKETGESHLYSNILCTLGYIQWRSEDPASAVSTFSEAFALRHKILGSLHNQTLEAQMLHGLSLRRMGRSKEAGAIFKQNLESWWKLIDATGEGHANAVRLAGLVVESLPYEQAHDSLQSTRDKINAAVGGGTLETHKLDLMLAQLCWKNRHYTESEAHFENCFQEAATDGATLRQMECCRTCLLKLLERDHSKALTWARRLAESHRRLNAKDGAAKRIDQTLVRGVFRLTGETMEDVSGCFQVDASRKTPSFLTTQGHPYPIPDALKDVGLLSEAIAAYSDCASFSNSFESVRIPHEISRAQLLVVSNQPAKAMNVIDDLQKDLSSESAGLADRYSTQVSLLKAIALSDLGRYREAIATIEPDANKMLLARKAFILLSQGIASELRDFVDNEFAPIVPPDDIFFASIIQLFHGAASLQNGTTFDPEKIEQAISQVRGSKIRQDTWWHAFGESLLGRKAILDQDVESAIVHLEKAAELWCSKHVRLISPNFFPTNVPRKSMLLLIETLRADGQNERAVHWETVLAAYHDSPVEHLVKPTTPQTATTVHGP